MRLASTPFVLSVIVLCWHHALAICETKYDCNSCTFQKDPITGTAGLCAFCRDLNDTSHGTCYEQTSIGPSECRGAFVFDGKTRAQLVQSSADCDLTANSDLLIAAVAGSVGGVLLAMLIVYVYYRKKKQKQERLASFRRRELEMHRSRKLKLDKELGLQRAPSGMNQRILAQHEAEKAQAAAALVASQPQPQPQPQTPEPVVKVDVDPPRIPREQRRRFKCMSKGGLRVRENPTSEAAKVGGIKYEVIVTALSVKGNWVQVSANGWAMIAGEEDRVFLQELAEGEEEDTVPEEKLDVVG